MSAAVHHPVRARLVLIRRAILRLMHWHGRALIWLAAFIMLVWGLIAAWLQWWFFPHIDEYRPRLVAELSQRVGRPVEIGRAVGGWHVGQPYLSLSDLALKHKDGRVALTLKRADATLSLWPLVLGQLRFDALTAIGPDLELTRDADGTIRLADIPLNEGSSDNSLGNWLLRQHSIAIEDGTLLWRDAYRKAPPLLLAHVNFNMSNRLFGSHDMALSAKPPTSLASEFSVHADWYGDDIGRFAAWHGNLNTTLSDVDLAAWGQWLPYPLEVRRGHGRVVADLKFVGEHVTDLDGALNINGASLRLARDLQPLDVSTLSGKINWSEHAGDGDLELSDIKLTAEGNNLLDGSRANLKLYARGGGEVSATSVTMPSLANLVPTLPLPNEIRRALAGVKPTGHIDRIAANWEGDWREPIHYAGDTEFTNLGLTAPAPAPTLGPLTGTLRVTDHDGQVTLLSHHFKFSAQNIYDELALDEVHAALNWTRANGLLTVNLTDFSAQNADIGATATAVWRWDGKGSGDLNLDAGLSHLTASKVSDYLPQSIGAETRSWLRAALTQGVATDAHFKLVGPLDKFPFGAGGGIWSVVTKLHGATLDYARGWPVLEGLDGEVRIDGNKLEVNAGANVLGAHIDHAHAMIVDLAKSDGIQVDGAISGATSEFFRFIAQSPLNKSLGGLGNTAHAQGEGKLDLKLDVPFEHSDDTKVSGTYRFTHNHLQIGDVMPELHELSGELYFNEREVHAKNLLGQALGGALKADIATQNDGAVVVSAEGRADAYQVLQRYEIPYAETASGTSDYQLQVVVPKSGLQIALTAPMSDVRVDLPAPLGKKAGERRPLKLAMESTESSERWRLAWGDIASGDVYRVPDGNNWHIDHGDIWVGPAPSQVAPHSGLQLNVNLPELSVDPWVTLITASRQVGGSTSTTPSLNAVDLHTKKLMAFDHRLDDVSLHLQPQSDGAWAVNVASQEVAGQGNWNGQGRGRLYARLEKLSLPLPSTEGAVASKDVGISRKLPSVDLAIDSFSINSHDLGKLEVKAQAVRDAWQIDSLTLLNPDGKLTMQGNWKALANDDLTSAKVVIDSTNIGKLLDRFGYGEVMRKGSGTLQGELNWHGSPMSPDYATMNGTLKVKAESGQFAKVEPGVGRLLGVLSLQSVRRRLTLDFHDIFGEGFAFDKIEGDSKITHGVLATDNLVIVGPAAQVLLKGEADVGNETQKLHVRIVPTIGDSLAVGAGVALANPVVGVGAFLLQRVLKDPLGRLVAYEYDVSGSWENPQVVRVGPIAKMTAEKANQIH